MSTKYYEIKAKIMQESVRKDMTDMLCPFTRNKCDTNGCVAYSFDAEITESMYEIPSCLLIHKEKRYRGHDVEEVAK